MWAWSWVTLKPPHCHGPRCSCGWVAVGSLSFCPHGELPALQMPRSQDGHPKALSCAL